MNDRNKPLAAEKSRKFFVCNTFCRKAPQHSRSHKNNSNTRIHQAFVDCSHHRHAEAKVLLAEPYSHPMSFKQIMKLLGGALPVIPCVTEKHISQVRLGYS